MLLHIFHVSSNLWCDSYTCKGSSPYVIIVYEYAWVILYICTHIKWHNRIHWQKKTRKWHSVGAYRAEIWRRERERMKMNSLWLCQWKERKISSILEVQFWQQSERCDLQQKKQSLSISHYNLWSNFNQTFKNC